MRPGVGPLAGDFGAVGHRADGVERFVEIAGAALDGGVVHVIDRPVDRSLDHEIPNVMIGDYACTS